MIALESNKFKTLVNMIKTCSDEFVVKFDKEGAHIVLLDKANVLMLSFDLKPEWFVQYSPAVTELGLSLTNISLVTSSVPKDCNIIFSPSDAKGTSIVISYTVGKSTYQGTVRCYDPKTMRSAPTNLGDIITRNKHRSYIVNMVCGDFLDALQTIGGFYQTGMIRSQIEFGFGDGSLQLSMVDNDDNKMSATISADIGTYGGETPHGKTAFMATFLGTFKIVLGIIPKDQYIEVYAAPEGVLIYDYIVYDNTAIIKMICAPVVCAQ